MADKKEQATYFIKEGKLFEDCPELGVRQVTRINRDDMDIDFAYSGPLEVRVNNDTIELWLFDELRHELSIGSDGYLKERVDDENFGYVIYADYEEKEHDEGEVEYAIKKGKLLAYHPNFGIRQLTHIKRLEGSEWSGSFEIRINGYTIELWLDENLGEGLDLDEDYEASYDELCHELTLRNRGSIFPGAWKCEFEGNVFDDFDYVFIYVDDKGIVTEDFADGNHLSENKYIPPPLPNPLLSRFTALLHVGYVLDAFHTDIVTDPGRFVLKSFNPNLDKIYLKHPNNKGFKSMELDREGSLRRRGWQNDDDDFHIAPDDDFGFSDFIRMARLPLKAQLFGWM
jgi:hypothetical protein